MLVYLELKQTYIINQQHSSWKLSELSQPLGTIAIPFKVFATASCDMIIAPRVVDLTLLQAIVY